MNRINSALTLNIKPFDIQNLTTEIGRILYENEYV